MVLKTKFDYGSLILGPWRRIVYNEFRRIYAAYYNPIPERATSCVNDEPPTWLGTVSVSALFVGHKNVPDPVFLIPR
jgi:hypothetical protein